MSGTEYLLYTAWPDLLLSLAILLPGRQLHAPWSSWDNRKWVHTRPFPHSQDRRRVLLGEGIGDPLTLEKGAQEYLGFIKELLGWDDTRTPVVDTKQTELESAV